MGINWLCRASCGKNGAAVATAASPPGAVAGAGGRTDDVGIVVASTGADVGIGAGVVVVAVVVVTVAGTPVFTGCIWLLPVLVPTSEPVPVAVALACNNNSPAGAIEASSPSPAGTAGTPIKPLPRLLPPLLLLLLLLQSWYIQPALSRENTASQFGLPITSC